MPVVDKSQDWVLLFGEENEFGTVLKFFRKINTCDTTEDELITVRKTCFLPLLSSKNDVAHKFTHLSSAERDNQ